MIAASKGYRFLCVTDPRCNLTTRRLMEALGGQVHIVVEPHPDGGLARRAASTTSARCARRTSRYVWLNQYSNPNTWLAHYRTTAPGDRPPVPRAGRAVRRGRAPPAR